MKIAVMNYSGNLGKTTQAHHLLTPRQSSIDVNAPKAANQQQRGERNDKRHGQQGDRS